MILKKLVINNIFSLQGEHIINFAQLQNESTLLAITGRTGAGKSTILNCISLVLYGQTALELNQDEFTTLGESKSKIELTFELRGVEYVCEWYCRNSTVKKKVEFENNIIEKGVNNFIADLLKLNFSQFSKAVILNQGQFADFITQKFTERKKILETLSNLQQLQGLGSELNRQITSLKKQIEELQNLVEHTRLLSKEQEQELTTQLQQNKEQLKTTQQHLEQLKLVHQVYTTVQGNNRRFLTTNERLVHNQKKLSDLDDLQNNNKITLAPLQHEYTKIEDDFTQLKPKITKAIEIEQILETAKSSLHTRQEHFEKIIIQKDQAKKKLEVLNQEVKQLKNKLNDFEQQFCTTSPILTTESITQLNTCLHQLELEHTQLVGLQQQQQQIEDDLQELNSNAATIQQKLKEIWVQYPTAKQDIELIDIIQQQLGQQLQQLQTVEQQLTELHKKEQRHQLEQQELTKALERQNQTAKQLTTLQQQLDNLNLQEDNLKLEIKNLQQLEHLSELNRAIMLLRQENSLHSTCQVCHAPLQANQQHDHTQLETTVDQQKIQQVQQQQEAVARQKQDLLVQIKSLEQNQQILQQQIQELQDSTKENDQLSQTLQDKQKEQQHLKQEYDQLTKLQQTIKHNLQELTEIERQQKKKQQLLDSLLQDIKTAEKNISVSAQQLQTQLHLKDVLTSTQRPLLINYLNMWNKLLQQQDYIINEQTNLDKWQQEYATVQKLQTELQSSITQNEQQLKNLLGSDYPKSATSIQQQWQNKLEMAHKAIRKIEQTIEEVERERRTVLGQIDNTKLQLEQLTTDSQQQLTKLEELSFADAPLKPLAHYHSKIAILITNPSEMQQREFEILIQDKVEQPLNEIMQIHQQLHDKIIKAQEQLNINQQQLEKIQQLQLDIQQLTEKLHAKQALSSIIGTDDFRTYLLSIIEQDLIVRANHELENLCEGRYRVTQKKDILYIIDSGHQALERKIASLSGGEKFMVSLAFALALSEMTRGLAQIDSFFIDEGFGSLDDQSLEEVLEMLTAVQARGKNIILISHQKELFQRIPINIHVEKQADDFSKISILYN